MKINSVCVIGGGLMGRQIAMNTAIHGIKATVYDLNETVCAAVEAWAEEYLAGRIAKGRMTEEQVAKTKSLFSVKRDLAEACDGVDCVIEAVVEREDIKRSVFRQLSDLLPETTIIATNSSTMVSSLFKDDVKNPARLCNMHYYNPALVMKFVEVVQGEHTSTETAQTCYDFCLKTGKKPAWLRKEISGFLGNYVYFGLSRNAKYLVQNGYCTPQDVDLALEEGCGAKMGPFRTNDLTGIDLTVDVLESVYKKTGEKPLMYDIYKQMVVEGRLGRKSGKGFYDYTKPETEQVKEIVELPGDKIIQSVAVVGGGRMGRQIAMSAAISGFQAKVYDLKEEVCADVEAWAEEYLADRIEKGCMTEEQVTKTKSLFCVERDLKKAVSDVDMVIEAVIEDKELKRQIFAQLNDLVAEDTILATNSSAMVSSTFADVVKNPSRLCNVHYSFPALVAKFVEVVQGEHTSEATARSCYNFCLKTGKKPARMRKEIAGFLCNYIYGGAQARGCYMVENGYCSPQDVDTALEYGFNYKMGPFRAQDFIGLDACFAIMESNYKNTGKKPDMYDIYKEMVEKGHLGRKTGKGFYDYE